MLDFRVDTFLTVCKYMNFTKAARHLHITQPGVSQHIRHLEEYYQVRLFDYQGRKLTLTHDGEIFRNAVTTMKHDEHHLKALFAGGQRGIPRLSIGLTLTVGEFALSQKLADYFARHKHLSGRIEIANTAKLLQSLDHGDIDVAIVEGYFARSEYDYLVYAKEAYLPLCAAQSPLGAQTLSFTDILSKRLITREPGSGTREILEKYLQERNLTLQDFAAVIEVSNLEVMKDMVAKGCGITFLYQAAVREELADGRLRQMKLDDFHIHHDFTFIWRKHSVFSAYYQELFAMLRDDGPAKAGDIVPVI